MMKQSYNHDLFIEKISKLDSKEAQYQMLRKYMLSLPTAEFDKFLFYNLDKIQQGIGELSVFEVSKEERKDLADSFDALIELAKSMRKPAITME